MLDILEGTFAFSEHLTPHVCGFGCRYPELFDEEPDDAFECDAVRGKMNAIERCVRWETWLGKCAPDVQVRIGMLIGSLSKIIVAEDPAITKPVFLILKIGFLHFHARPARRRLTIEHERQP